MTTVNATIFAKGIDALAESIAQSLSGLTFEYLHRPAQNLTVRVSFNTDDYWYVEGVRLDPARDASFFVEVTVPKYTVTDTDVGQFVTRARDNITAALNGYYPHLKVPISPSVVVNELAGDQFRATRQNGN